MNQPTAEFMLYYAFRFTCDFWLSSLLSSVPFWVSWRPKIYPSPRLFSTHWWQAMLVQGERNCLFCYTLLCSTAHGVSVCIEPIRLSKPAVFSPCAGTLRVLRTSWLWWREQELNRVPTLTQHSWTLTLRRETWTAWKRCVFIQFAIKMMLTQHVYVCIQWVFPFIIFSDSGNRS